jgi:transposase
MIVNRLTKIFIHKAPVDMRASFNVLCLKVQENFPGGNPYSGHLYVFTNARRSYLKALYYDGTGLVLVCKKLEKGTLFSKINQLYQKQIVLSNAEFNLYFEGSDLNKRFIESPMENKKK